MSLREWIQAQALIVSLWPHARQLTEDQLRLQHQLVAELPADQIHAAIVAHSRSGAEFPPLPGQLAHKCSLKLAGGAAPTWAATCTLLANAAARFGRSREADALDWLAERSPHAAQFAVEHGWRRWCTEEIDDPAYGGAVRRRLEESYGYIAARVDSATTQGLPVPDVQNRIQALAEGGHHLPRRTGLRRIEAPPALGRSEGSPSRVDSPPSEVAA